MRDKRCDGCEFLCRVGAWKCLKSNRVVGLHWEANYCPLNKFGTGEKPQGWQELSPNELALLKMEGAGMTPDEAAATAKRGSCCDPPKE